MKKSKLVVLFMKLVIPGWIKKIMVKLLMF